MEYTIVYKKENTIIKDTFDFSTNPVFFQRFDTESDDDETIEDDMIIDNEAAKKIRCILIQPDLLFFSIIDENRKLYHDFEDFFKNIY